MTSFSENRGSGQTRTYDRGKSVVFRKTSEAFGGLSNMASGFPLGVNGIRVLTSEALYQACRFPHLQKVQWLIIEQASPMTAKMKSKPYRRESRPDWDQVRVKIMRWCLRVKLAQNWNKFGELLLGTGDRPIVEESRKDEFWGAKAVDDQTLIGMNVLGRLLMELREELRSGRHERLLRVDPLQIPDFLLDGRSIERIVAKMASVATSVRREVASTKPPVPKPGDAVQPSLFEQPSLPAHPELPRLTPEPGQGLVSILKSYPAYKDSGVPWLGEVPEHWEVQRLKSRTANVIEQTVDHQPGEIYVALEHVEGWTGQLRDAGSDAAFDSQVKRFRTGDVLFGKLRPYLAKVARPTRDGVCVGEFFVLRPRGYGSSAAYLEHLLRSKPIIDAINSSTFGAKMPRADWQFVGSVALSFPPLPEQSAIVRFLDQADRRIRRYIRAKQKLIALLNEQKQAIIHRAVTRGLDPNVRLKPSGVQWLGDVPEHWEVMPLRRLTVSRCDGPFGSGLKSSHYADQGIRVVRLQNIGHAEFKDSDTAFIPLSYYATLGDHTVEPGDLLIAGLGDEHHPAGRACVAPSFIVPAMVKADCFRFRVFRQRLDPEFAALHLTATAVDASSLLSTGATRQRTNLQATASRSVAIPPMQEQLAIVKHITDETSSLGRAIRDADREISLLREYRTRLIADVVTSKLDVREAAARLRDDAEEPEPLDDADSFTDTEEDALDDLDAVPEETET